MALAALVLGLCMLLLAACGERTEPGREDKADAGRAGPKPLVTGAYPFRETWTGDLKALEARRIVRMLTVYSIGRYYIEGGQPKGVVVEGARRLEEYLNRQRPRRSPRVYVAIIPVGRDELVPALLAGHGDIINAGLAITAERKQVMDFSIPITAELSEILVTGPRSPKIGSLDDLAGQVLFVRESSSYRESIEQINRDFEARGLEPIQLAYISELLEDEDLIEMVHSGLLPWAVADSYRVQQWSRVFGDIVPREDIVFRSDVRLAWAFRKGSPQLASTLNAFLERNREGTLVGNVIRNRYLRQFEWTENALEKAQMDRFSELEHLFRKYGEQYEVDYLLAAAQGFQESHLKQNARSRAGAVGIMQLLPRTARDPNVGIPDIHKAEANIHAGIKYLDFLRRQYFSEPGIDDINRQLFALAAYNAGPSRIVAARGKAAKQGYDPDVWFDNVELVVARDVGQQPVQYVANIFKYYLAYRYSIEQMARRKAAREKAGMG